MYNEVIGDLIELALASEFDVITHGCNCFCTMGAGIAVPMKKAFGCDKFPLEDLTYKGDFNKLGQIDWAIIWTEYIQLTKPLFVVNSYTQYNYGGVAPFDYEAFTLCMRKINHIFPHKHIGLPKIGAGLAGGNWETIKQIIKQELKDCDVTVVIYNK